MSRCTERGGGGRVLNSFLAGWADPYERGSGTSSSIKGEGL
jgi:hypothetical protein